MAAEKASPHRSCSPLNRPPPRRRPSSSSFDGGVLERWSAGALECWSAGVLERWSAGVWSVECGVWSGGARRGYRALAQGFNPGNYHC